MRNTIGSWSWGYRIFYFYISYPRKDLSIPAEKQTINTQQHSKAHSEFFLLISQRSFPNIISFRLYHNLMKKPEHYSPFPLKETEMFNDLLKIPPVPLKDPWTHTSDFPSLPLLWATSPHCEINPCTRARFIGWWKLWAEGEWNQMCKLTSVTVIHIYTHIFPFLIL